jgi:hypothetical protein
MTHRLAQDLRIETPGGDPHLADAGAILAAIRSSCAREIRPRAIEPADAGLPRPAGYQRHLCSRFGDLIATPSFEYLSKTATSWLPVGDRRLELSARFRLLVEQHGLGPAMLVLHLQQVRAGHILTEILEDGVARNLAVDTAAVAGSGGERVLCIPLRQFRADFPRLADLSIAKPTRLWDARRIVTHEPDDHPCAYCSCHEINPAEVTVDLDGARHGLSRDYRLGFTFAPFGNPLAVVHFLAWDRAAAPLNMNRVPMTVSDLVKLTREVNRTIRAFFADTGITDFPSLDGISNGWAGNSVFHQHFQFFAPEQPLPILHARARAPALVRRDDVEVARLDWPSPVYRIRAADALNTGLVGNDMAGIWRLLGGSRRSPYKPFPAGHVPSGRELVPAHTQNVHVPGADLGATAHVFLRDRDRVDYAPEPDEWIGGPESDARAQAKRNLGALEMAGAVIVDDAATFDAMRSWPAEDVSRQVRRMIGAMSPAANKVSEFESALEELFPA